MAARRGVPRGQHVLTVAVGHSGVLLAETRRQLIDLGLSPTVAQSLCCQLNDLSALKVLAITRATPRLPHVLPGAAREALRAAKLRRAAARPAARLQHQRHRAASEARRSLYCRHGDLVNCRVCPPGFGARPHAESVQELLEACMAGRRTHHALQI